MKKITTKTVICLKSFKKHALRISNNSHIIYLNNFYPFSNFLKRFPKSLFEVLEELNEHHEIELYDRIFLIKQLKREMIKTNEENKNIISSIKHHLIILKNKTLISLNLKILKIFFNTSNIERAHK